MADSGIFTGERGDISRPPILLSVSEGGALGELLEHLFLCDDKDRDSCECLAPLKFPFRSCVMVKWVTVTDGCTCRSREDYPNVRVH